MAESPSASVVNEAVMMIGGNQPLVTGAAPTFDNSTTGSAASQLYVPTVATVGRQFGWDFSRNTVTLVPTGNAAPFPWSHEYSYPTMGVQVLQLMPTSISDPNNPLPVEWNVANNIVSSVQTKVIQTNLSPAQALFTNQPVETTWDPLFRETVVRLLSSAMAMAIGGRPDTAREMLDSAGQFSNIGMTRRD